MSPPELQLVSDNPTPRPWPYRRFMMSPAQHRRQAELLRDAGDRELARRHDELARAIERRHAPPC